MSAGLVLGFDFGLARIGVAAGQPITQTASPVTTLKAQDGNPDQAQLAELIKQWRPKTLVVGIPLNTDGTESDMSTKARKFAQDLSVFALPVELVDERYSTRAARWQLEDIHGSRLGYKKVDALAACLIVESFLCQKP